MNFVNDKAFIYVIYDKDIYEIFEVFILERDCIKAYKDFYEGFVNVGWKAINIIDLLKGD